jgi:hypothetical protein
LCVYELRVNNIIIDNVLSQLCDEIDEARNHGNCVLIPAIAIIQSAKC